MQAHHFYIHLQEPQFSNDLNHLNQFLTQNAFVDRTFKFVPADQPYWSVLFLSKPKSAIKNQEDDTFAIPAEFGKEIKTAPDPKTLDMSTMSRSDLDLYDQLKAWRTSEASSLKIAPFVICTNQCLVHIVNMKPDSLENLLKVPGWGPAKNDKYGLEVLNIISAMGAVELD